MLILPAEQCLHSLYKTANTGCFLPYKSGQSPSKGHGISDDNISRWLFQDFSAGCKWGISWSIRRWQNSLIRLNFLPRAWIKWGVPRICAELVRTRSVPI